MILRNDDLDSTRYKMEFVEAMLEDMRWFGFEWSEGPDVGGSYAPYNQSERMEHYQAALEKLRAGGFIYPCTCSRRDIQQAVTAPHAADDELIYPGTCRTKGDAWRAVGDKPGGVQLETALEIKIGANDSLLPGQAGRLCYTGSGSVVERSAGVPPAGIKGSERIRPPGDAMSPGTRHAALRFRVPDGETIAFLDQNLGAQKFIAGKDFGDFVVWRGDGVPAYQLSCAVDDAAMGITEVVRGADLLVSTARQILIYRALGLTPPAFFHCELMLDDQGQRLAKRHDALSLRTLRGRGISPAELRAGWGAADKPN
jgi:glutamyl-tRNA synthetase